MTNVVSKMFNKDINGNSLQFDELNVDVDID
jgi:hypothetical protein